MISSVPLAHLARGPGEAIALVFVSATAVFGVAFFILLDASRRRPPLRKAAIGSAVLAGTCVFLAYGSLLFIGGAWRANRPTATARLEILSPRADSVFRGDPAVVQVRLRLVGGRLVSSASSKPVPNVGHIHVYLDGKLAAMATALTARLRVSPGRHDLEADFVASDHGPFKRPVRQTVTFSVQAEGN
jgi:hypothetical protein